MSRVCCKNRLLAFAAWPICVIPIIVFRILVVCPYIEYGVVSGVNSTTMRLPTT